MKKCAECLYYYKKESWCIERHRFIEHPKKENDCYEYEMGYWVRFKTWVKGLLWL
jgi:hypothetical protein